jgi:hypothetical protein
MGLKTPLAGMIKLSADGSEALFFMKALTSAMIADVLCRFRLPLATVVAPQDPRARAGLRELDPKTSCSKSVRRQVRVPPIWPAPMMPIFVVLHLCAGSDGPRSFVAGPFSCHHR